MDLSLLGFKVSLAEAVGHFLDNPPGPGSSDGSHVAIKVYVAGFGVAEVDLPFTPEVVKAVEDLVQDQMFLDELPE